GETRDLDLELWIAGERVLERLEGLRGGETNMDGLEIVLALVGRLDHGAITPDLRLREAAVRGEDADDFPGVFADLEFLAHVETVENGGGARADDHFIPAGFEAAAFDHLDIASHIEGSG